VTAPTQTLNPLQAAIIRAYAQGRDIGDIATDRQMRREAIGAILVQLCGLKRATARQMVLAGLTGPLHVQPTAPAPIPPAARPKPATARRSKRRAAPVTVVRARPAEKPPMTEPLSDREQQVLDLIVAGLTNYYIGLRLDLQAGSVKNIVTKIYCKLGVDTRREAIAAARARELARTPAGQL
jgi:ATP/maltotriose-dependent transcriptional regulator MalT